MPPREDMVDIRQLAHDLNASRDELNRALLRLETAFAAKLEGARGRVRVRVNKDGWIEHFAFRNNRFFYDNGWPGEPLEATPLLESAIEIRMLFCTKIPEMLEACGGTHLFPKADAPGR